MKTPFRKAWKCPQCERVVFVTGDEAEMKRLLGPFQGSVPCPYALCGGRQMEVDPLMVRTSRSRENMDLYDFYRAISGHGGASSKLVRKLFLEQAAGRIVLLDIESAGDPERTIIKQIIFEDGTRMHFGVSSKGACIYYVEEPHVHTEAVAEGGDTNREEAGRATAGEIPIRELGSESRRVLHSVPTIEPAGSEPVPAVSETGDLSAGDGEHSDIPEPDPDREDGDHPRVQV